jgi:tetratricopeptide (TPR) repeat protein
MKNYEVLIKNGDFPGAERVLLRLLSEDRNNAIYNFSLGVVYAILSDFLHAKLYLKIASNLEPSNVEILNNLGNVLCELKEFNDALNCFSLAIKLSSSSNASLFFNRGRANHINKNYLDAINDYITALHISPHFLDAQNNLSLCYILTGNLKSAEIILKDLLKQYPHQFTYHLNLANLYFSLYDKQNCIFHYKKVLELEPKNFINYFNIANAYNHFNESTDEALSNYNFSIGLNPNHIDSYIGRGNLYNKLNLFSESISDFDKAVSLDEHNIVAYYNLGCTYLEIKDITNALINFDIVISKDKNHYYALFNYSLVLLLSGNYLEGWKFYEYRYDCNSFPSISLQSNKPSLKAS